MDRVEAKQIEALDVIEKVSTPRQLQRQHVGRQPDSLGVNNMALAADGCFRMHVFAIDNDHCPNREYQHTCEIPLAAIYSMLDWSYRDALTCKRVCTPARSFACCVGQAVSIFTSNTQLSETSALAPLLQQAEELQNEAREAVASGPADADLSNLQGLADSLGEFAGHS